ncbi:MAG: YihY/virulence factor BrkB family protein [Ornithinimicrobium sp.]
MSFVARLDAFQRRHAVLGYPLGVIYKFFDDQGNYLAMTITYNAFVAVFPLLLISSSVLGFVLQDNVDLQQTILNSAVGEFPIIGTQLSTPQGIRGSFGAVLAGSLVALYGVLGLGQAVQNAVNVGWSVPRNSRRNPFKSRLWSALLLSLAGMVVLGLALLTNFSGSLMGQLPELTQGIEWLVQGASLAVTVAGLTLLLRWAGPTRSPWRQTVPGAAFIVLVWIAVQRFGGLYVDRVLARVDDVSAVFALSLGLIGLIYVAANALVLGVEINVVLAESLFPRALLTPFTDQVDLTDADRRAYTRYAQAQRHKGFELVEVDFTADATDTSADSGGSTTSLTGDQKVT